jgi:UDP-glucose 4-epimerase
MNILITGGAGYIGSITNWYLRSKGHTTVIFDNLAQGHKESVGDTELIVGDLTNASDISTAFEGRNIDAVIHFAAMALAGESMEKPYQYFKNNILGGLNLLEAMRTHGVKSIVFSSTCAVYGYPQTLPVTEDMPIAPVSVYGASKRHFEEILSWYEIVYGIRHAKLRYFNACGAMADGSLGEAHTPETHIIPVALSQSMSDTPTFTMFGSDYKTSDGTCVRDYIHVLDLASAHVLAAKKIIENDSSLTVNLGVGRGYSNLEVIAAVEKITGKKFIIKNAPRRPGDPDAIYADNSKAKEILGWQPEYTDIAKIIETVWQWQKSHPRGY